MGANQRSGVGAHEKGSQPKPETRPSPAGHTEEPFDTSSDDSVLRHLSTLRDAPRRVFLEETRYVRRTTQQLVPAPACAQPPTSDLDPEWHRQGELAYGKTKWRKKNKYQAYCSDSEFAYARYTPVTIQNPQDFNAAGYTLRVQEQGRKIKMLINVTLFNEPISEVDFTLDGLAECIDSVCGNNSEGVLGQGLKIADWTEILICIIQDGLPCCKQDVLQAMQNSGLFYPELIKPKVHGQETALHLFEYTIRRKLKDGRLSPPLQCLFAPKAVNRGKLSSHIWYLQGFGRALDPMITYIFDAGTQPFKHCLTHMQLDFERHPKCAGNSGSFYSYFEGVEGNWLAGHQFIENKMGITLGKPQFALPGYLMVLPGAFCGWRWEAIQGRPLDTYFSSLFHQTDPSPYDKNRALVEDRLMCMEVVAKKGCDWKLHFVPDAIAVYDPVMDIASLMKQRRRWVNGGTCCLFKETYRMGGLWRESTHSIVHKMFMTLNFLYSWWCTCFNLWLGVGVYYYLTTTMITVSTRPGDLPDSIPEAGKKVISIFGQAIIFAYTCTVMLEMVASVMIKPEKVRMFHRWILIFFVFYQWCLTACIIGRSYLAFATGDIDPLDTTIRYFISAVLIVLFLYELMHGNVFKMMWAMVQYWSLMAAYTNIVMTYTCANMGDLAWGTKSLDKETELAKMTKEEGQWEAGYFQAVYAWEQESHRTTSASGTLGGKESCMLKPRLSNLSRVGNAAGGEGKDKDKSSMSTRPYDSIDLSGASSPSSLEATAATLVDAKDIKVSLHPAHGSVTPPSDFALPLSGSASSLATPVPKKKQARGEAVQPSTPKGQEDPETRLKIFGFYSYVGYILGNIGIVVIGKLAAQAAQSACPPEHGELEEQPGMTPSAISVVIPFINDNYEAKQCDGQVTLLILAARTITVTVIISMACSLLFLFIFWSKKLWFALVLWYQKWQHYRREKAIQQVVQQLSLPLPPAPESDANVANVKKGNEAQDVEAAAPAPRP